MISRLDINADLGEFDGPPDEAALALLRVVTSVNVACGGHAGDEDSMRGTIADAVRRGVTIGAHPSYPDRDGFGRHAMAMSTGAIAACVAEQVRVLCDCAGREGGVVRHVKPHGALYNVAWRDSDVAAAIVAGIDSVDPTLALYAPHGSALAGAAASHRVIYEGFLDRAYEDDGTLVPRGVPGAVLHDAEVACARAVDWARTGVVTARTGRALALPIETLCVHGDTSGALALATRTRAALDAAGVHVVAWNAEYHV